MEKPKCKFCGDRHWFLDPCKAKSTTVNLAGRVEPQRAVEASTPKAKRKAKADSSELERFSGGIRSGRGISAPTQPVDTNQPEGQSQDAGKPVRSRPDTKSRPAPTGVDASSAGTEGDKDRQPIRKGDRHRPGYMAEYMRKRRAKERM